MLKFLVRHFLVTNFKMDSKQTLIIDLYRSQFDRGIIETVQSVISRVYATKGDRPDVSICITNSSSFQAFLNLNSLSIEDTIKKLHKLASLFHLNIPSTFTFDLPTPIIFLTTRSVSITSSSPVLVLSNQLEQYEHHKSVTWNEGLHVLESALSAALSAAEVSPITISTPECNIRAHVVRFFVKNPWFATHTVCKCHRAKLDSAESNICPVTQIRLNSSSKVRISSFAKATMDSELRLNPVIRVRCTFPTLSIPLNVIAGEAMTIFPADSSLAPFVKYLRDDTAAALAFWMGRCVILLPSNTDNSLVLFPITFSEALLPPPRNQYVFLDNEISSSYGVRSDEDFRLSSITEFLNDETRNNFE